MALKKVKGSLERVFDKNLQDLVRGIRNNKENEVGGSKETDVIFKNFIVNKNDIKSYSVMN